MKRTLILVMAILAASPGLCLGQASGNIAFSQGGGKARAEQDERAKHLLPKDDRPPNATGMFIDANVLMNVKADEYVVAFAVAEEGKTVAECSQKMDATIKEFTAALKELGIGDDDLDVDFVAQSKVYGFEVKDNVALEKLVGFEQKKNVSIHYKDRSLLDKLIVAAARSRIFDLIKVDYIVKDSRRIQDRLLDEAARIIKQKVARRESLLGLKLLPPAQIYAERPAIYYPPQMYDSYMPHESEEIGNASIRQRFTVQERARAGPSSSTPWTPTASTR